MDPVLRRKAVYAVLLFLAAMFGGTIMQVVDKARDFSQRGATRAEQITREVRQVRDDVDQVVDDVSRLPDSVKADLAALEQLLVDIDSASTPQDLDAVLGRLAALQAELEEARLRQGPAGPPGPTGAPGPAGPATAPAPSPTTTAPAGPAGTTTTTRPATATTTTSTTRPCNVRALGLCARVPLLSTRANEVR